MAKQPGKIRSSKSATYNRPIKDYEPPTIEPPELKPNFDLLDEEMKESLRKKAAARVEARERDRAMEAYLDAEVERIERSVHPEAYEEEKEIAIDLAIYADRIIINGKHYMHGRTYKVKKSLHDCLQEIMWQTHKHYAATHKDPTKVFYDSQREVTKSGPSYATISGSTGQVTKF